MKKTRPIRILRYSFYFRGNKAICRQHVDNQRAPEPVFLPPQAMPGRKREHAARWGARAREQRDRRAA